MKGPTLSDEAVGWAAQYVARWSGNGDAALDALVDLLAKVRNRAFDEAAVECEGERMACERHARALPKAPIHQVGIQIADVCARRVRRLKNEP